ncbi:MAG: glycosyltransferase family 4 protein [Planctomycetes bacterium]|nr:glycosyltransferase family 4 protein [Planctomycetota bacterium]
MRPSSAMRPKETISLEASGTLVPRPTGIANYARGLIRALARRSPGRYELLCPLGRALRALRTPAVRDLADAVPLRLYLSGRRLERRTALVHALDTRLPSAYRGPLVATLFDTISLLESSAGLGLSSRRFRERKARAYGEIARRAQAIVTLSEAVRREVIQRLPTRARVVVVPPGIDPPDPQSQGEAARAALARRGIEPPYVLAVGALCPRKNIEGAVRAFERAAARSPGLRLVLAGEPAYGWAGNAGERAVRRLGGRAHLAGYLPRRELLAAYAHAAALVHLAHYEGFGLTVAEALQAGVPVVASSAGGIPEAAGGAAWLVDPADEAAAGEALARVLEGGPEVEERRERGLRHAASLSWDAAAEGIERLHHEILGLEVLPGRSSTEV